MVFLIQEGGAGVLKLEGYMGVERAADLKESILHALGSAERLYVDVENITSLDLSCLQVLCSAHRTAVSMNKEFAIKGTLPEVFTEVAESSGFMLQKGCTKETEGTCLWVRDSRGHI